MFVKKVIVVSLLAGVVALGIVIARNRPTADQDAVVYRQALMTVIGDQTQPLLLMQRGQIPYSAALAGRHAGNLVTLAGMIPEAFVRNTSAARRLDTAALPYVWSDRTDFLHSAQRLQSDAATLQSALESGNAVRIDSAIAALGGQCEQCHRAFRDD